MIPGVCCCKSHRVFFLSGRSSLHRNGFFSCSPGQVSSVLFNTSGVFVAFKKEGEPSSSSLSRFVSSLRRTHENVGASEGEQASDESFPSSKVKEEDEEEERQGEAVLR